MMSSIPTLHTQRLVLRPFRLNDAADVQRLAGDRAVAATTLSIPHPYQDGVAEEWIRTHPESFESGKGVVLAITLGNCGSLIGSIGLDISRSHSRAELGYWIGKPYWNSGYCSEAAAAIVQYGFGPMQLHRIFAHHFTSNPASGRVMQKIGMTQEGLLRHHVIKWGEPCDLAVYGLINPSSRGVRRLD